MNKKLFFLFLCTLTCSLLESKGPPKEEPQKRKRSFFKFAVSYQENEPLRDDEIPPNTDEVTPLPS